jgi:eukaryotic-like serine/threonine-protein kinase
VGPLSDQYSLGAILYELLTGRPPFKGSSIFDTLQQVRTLEPVPPIDFQPGVPRDLETICLKCLQKDAAKRYASDQALAEDLGRFLAGEPILARPVGPAERLWRWCKRNPRVAALVGTIAFLFVAWAVSASFLSWGLKIQTDEANKQTRIAQENEGKAKEQTELAVQKKKEADASAEEATKQKGIAQDNEKRAKDTAERTIEQMVNLGSNLHDRLDSTLLAPMSAQELRQQFLDLLKQSLVLLSRTIEGQGTTKYGPSRVSQALGDLHLGAGQSQEATKMYQQAYEAMKKLSQAEPEDDLTQANFAMTIIRLGDVSLQAPGDARTSLAIYKRAREVDEGVLKRPGRTREEWKAKLDVSHTDIRVAQALLALGQSAEAGKYLDEARTYWQYWLDMDNKKWEPSEWIMEACLWQGIAAAQRGDEKAAREQFDEAIRIGDDLIKRYPTHREFQGDMAESQGAFGDALMRFGQPEEAEKNYEKSLANFQAQLKAEPHNLKLQPMLAWAHERLGAVNTARGKPAEAKKHYEEALRIRKALWQIEPSNLVREAAYLLTLARSGQRDEAATGAAKLKARAEKKTVLHLDVARCYATCAAGDTPKKREYAEQALSALKLAIAAPDFKDAFALKTDFDLEALRSDPAFRAVIDEVKKR